jgi:hypothetical protein
VQHRFKWNRFPKASVGPVLHIITLEGIIVIMLVVLYGCETWSLTFREERRFRVFENRVLRRIFGLKRDEVTGEWRKLHIEELNDLYSSPNIFRVTKSRRMVWVWRAARIGERRGVDRVFVGDT